ncbi:hypothetical protein [Photobacterium nomapromontoriensis]|uniref:hypothetical protein n=1 Tax=Photobacterium nomapromontoriensis TaxID=2910237 RepID=UPI003D1301B2
MATNERDPLVDAVGELTQETTALLQEYRNAKTSLDGKVSQAGNSASVATSKASEASVSAAAAAESEVKAKASEVRADAAADRAAEIAGLDTVTQAVALAMGDRYTGALQASLYNLMCQMNRNRYNGSGVIHAGKHFDNPSAPINQGMWCHPQSTDAKSTVLHIGRRGSYSGGTSKSGCPVFNFNGHEFHLDLGSGQNGSDYDYCAIQYPDAPAGYESFNESTGEYFNYFTTIDPKYGNVAESQNEAVIRCFEGKGKNSDFRLGDQYWGLDVSGGSSVVITTDGAKVIADASSPYAGVSQSHVVGGIIPSDYCVDVDLQDIVGSVYLEVYLYASGGGSNDARVIEQNPVNGINRFYFKAADFTNGFGSSDVILARIRHVGATGSSSVTIKGFHVYDPNDKPTLTRQDFSALEVWHEDVSELGVAFLKGGVQSTITSWNGIPTKLITDCGIAQGYSACGAWDKETIGRCIPLADFGFAKLMEFIQDPTNGMYFDDATLKLIQVRGRGRTIQGMGDNWEAALPYDSNKMSYCQYSSTKRIHPQGKRQSTLDYGTTFPVYCSHVNTSQNPIISEGLFTAASDVLALDTSSAYEGKCFMLPIALTQRMNFAAYHPSYNPFGCDRFGKQGAGSAYWNTAFSDGTKVTDYIKSTKDCFITFENPSNVGRYGAAGSIGSKLNGRPTNDPYPFHDGIYAGQIQDLRVSAVDRPYTEIMTACGRDAVAGVMRGKGRVPFTKAIAGVGVLSSLPHSGATTVIRLAENYGVDAGSNTDRDSGIANGCYFIDSASVIHKVRYCKTDATDGKTWIYVASSISDVDISANVSYINAEYTTPEFDILPMANLVGTPENIASTFPDGCIGEWISTIPTGSLKEFSFTKKSSNPVNPLAIYTSDNGATWGSSSSWGGWDSIKNSQIWAITDLSVNIYFYPSLSAFTQAHDNTAIVDELGNVFVSSGVHFYNRGNRLMQSVTGLIGISESAPFNENVPMVSAAFYENDSLNPSSRNRHYPINIGAPTNESPAFKALISLININGLMYPQWHWSELVYSRKSQAKTLVAGSALAVTKGDVIKLSGFSNSAIQCQLLTWIGTSNTSVTWGSNYFDDFTIMPDGRLYRLRDGNVHDQVKLFSLSDNWGDDGVIPVINGEGTKTDLNGNIVKVGCHRGQFPVGIAPSK